jgi:hypothetical protein
MPSTSRRKTEPRALTTPREYVANLAHWMGRDYPSHEV